MPQDQISYYRRREQDERQMARVAPEPSIRRIHLDMAARYAQLAAEEPHIAES
ncbi:hypothetical protein [Flavisphingomonas formosensis]|uniref:hypothetical protein n=1 Tax=Flavisphingomonas formosensis TaxID=861534 RepID=UPI0012FCDA63|nr:hypothetical protein [Sphingomonas formosensis]